MACLIYMRKLLPNFEQFLTFLKKIRISIAKCWMGKTETLNEAEDLVRKITSFFIVLIFHQLFWNEFCPAFTSWVGPETGATATGTGYLKETWDQTSSLHSIHFRQVNFPTATTVYFHCELKVCKNSEETTCSTTKLGVFFIIFCNQISMQTAAICMQNFERFRRCS